MPRQIFRTAGWGMLLMLGACLWWGPGRSPAGALAQTLPPRPSVTATPKPAGHSGSGSAPSATARVAGTVIELNSGAPAPGVAVMVGAHTLTTDANGNYDLGGLPAGTYQIALILAAEQGTPAQGPVTIALGAGATVIQHLGFRAPAAPAATPTAALAAVVRPAELPRTAGATDHAWLALLLVAALISLGAWARRRGMR